MLQNFFLRRFQYNQQTQRFFMTIIAMGFVIDGVYAVLLNLYLLRLGYDTRFIGQLNSVGLLTFAIISLPAGIFGARWTSSRMMRLGIAGILLGTTLLPLTEFLAIDLRGIGLILTYACILAGFSLYFVNSAPFLMSITHADRQNNAFAMQTALLALAAFIGSLFAGNLPTLIAFLFDFSLDDPQPYRYTLLLVAFVVVIALAITMTLVQPADESESDISLTQDSGIVEKPKRGQIARATLILIGLMSLVRFLQVAGLGTASVFFNVYMDTQLAMSPSTIGIIAALGRIIAVPVVLLAPRIIARSSTGAVATWASFATAICLLPIALIPEAWAAAIGYILALAMTNLRFTAFIVYIMVLVPKNRQPLMAGAGEMAAGFSFALMALTGGYIATVFGFRELFLLGAILTALGTLIFWLHLRQRVNH